MSLVFGANITDRVDHGTLDAVDWDQVSWAGWFYITTFTDGRVIFSRNTAGFAFSLSLNTSAGNHLAFTWGSGGSNMSYVNATSITTNKWWFFGITADRTLTGGGTGVRAHMYIGDLSTTVAEDSYLGQADGDSLHNCSTFPYMIGNEGTLVVSLQGSVAVATILGNQILSLGDIRKFQWRPNKYWNNQFVFSRLGHHGATDVPDLSGHGFPGTITGATLGDDIPLSPWFGYDDPSLLYTGNKTAILSGTGLIMTEADVVAGGKTIIATLSGDSFILN